MKFLNKKNYTKKIQKIKRAAELWLHTMSYDLTSIQLEEAKKFDQYGFNYADGLVRLQVAIEQAGYSGEFNDQGGMSSIHWVLFACLANVGSIKNILEIGTYDGKTARILSKLFPDSQIITVDLPDDDPILKNSYSRNSEAEWRVYCENQRRNTRFPNIHYHAINSFFLPQLVQDQKFDLIWVDGGHHYPEVAWDICNAYHMCADGGWLMCDDIIRNKNGFRNEQVSPDSFVVLEYLRARTNDDITYFVKREDPVWSADPFKRKFVSLMRKKS